MRQCLGILIVALALTVATGPAGSLAGEQADWGKVVSVGTARDGGMLLIENDRGLHVVIVDPAGEVRTNARKLTTLARIKPEDHIDFASSPWAGMQIVDLIVITPSPIGKVATVR